MEANEKVMERALTFDLSNVTERYVKDHGVSDEIARLHEVECKKYLMLCGMHPDTKLGMKGPVDNYWHTFLLFTKDYSDFCQSVAGRFIHHVPNMKKGTDLDSNTFPMTMELYRSTFGETPDHRAWGYAGLSATTCNEDCKDECSSGPGTDDCSPTQPADDTGPSCDNK